MQKRVITQNPFSGIDITKLIYIIPLLLAAAVIIIVALKLKKKPLSHIDGEIYYGSLGDPLDSVISLAGKSKIQISIGKETISDFHILTHRGVSFMFTILARTTSTDDVLVSVVCSPPGMMRYGGKIMSTADLYDNDTFIIHGVEFKYISNRKAKPGRDILQERGVV